VNEKCSNLSLIKDYKKLHQQINVTSMSMYYKLNKKKAKQINTNANSTDF